MKTKIFYGWVIVAATTVTYFVGGGTRAGFFGVSLKPLSQEFGWSRGSIAGAASLGSVQGSFVGPIVGFLSDKYGPRIVMMTGFVISTVGFLLLSVVHSLWLFYFSYVALITLGFGAVQLPGQAAVGNWFRRKRARAFSILTTGFALGGAVLTPVIAWLVSNYGWRTTSVIIGVTSGAIGMLVTALIRRNPEQYGYKPDGESVDTVPTPPVGASVPKSHNRGEATAPEVDFTVREVLRTRAFWYIGIGSGLAQLVTGSVMIHTIPLLTDRGVSAQVAANYVGLAFFWGLVGRIMWGAVGDFLPKRYLLALAVIIQSIGTFILAYATTNIHLHLYALLYGVGQGIVPVGFAIRGEYFGRKRFATVGGLMQGFGTLGGVIGPIYAGWAFDVTKSYTAALTILAFASLSASIFYFFARRPAPPKQSVVSLKKEI